MFSMPEPMPKDVEAVFAAFDPHLRRQLELCRDHILSTAEEVDGVGALTETLKWGQPSYLTEASKSGSTIRVDAIAGTDDKYALYFICNTNLVERFREVYPETFNYQGNRAIIFDVSEPLPKEEIKHCIAMALTYHLK